MVLAKLLKPFCASVSFSVKWGRILLPTGSVVVGIKCHRLPSEHQAKSKSSINDLTAHGRLSVAFLGCSLSEGRSHGGFSGTLDSASLGGKPDIPAAQSRSREMFTGSRPLVWALLYVFLRPPGGGI